MENTMITTLAPLATTMTAAARVKMAGWVPADAVRPMRMHELSMQAVTVFFVVLLLAMFFWPKEAKQKP